MAEPVVIDGEHLTLEDVERVARDGPPVAIAGTADVQVRAGRAVVERMLAEGRTVYGVTTGFGELRNVKIELHDITRLQQNLIRSHSVGVGEPFSEPVTRAIMLLRANTLAKGLSGIRPEPLRLLVDMLNRRVHPVIPQQGSVGASGDLAPLAHLALAMIGEGQVVLDGQTLPSQEAFRQAGLAPLTLEAKEGIALINGTPVMTAAGVLTLLDAERLSALADIAGGMSVEALKATDTAFDLRIHRSRPHAGQLACARNLLALVRDSEIIASHKDCPEVQDAYSLRCIPQVHGATKDALRYVRGVLEIEINAVTDNPMVFPDDHTALSGGNFHGQPVALALDFLGIAIAELVNISERRIERLVNPQLSRGLPPFLAAHSGLNSGFMIAQVVAAALVSENKLLASPASVDSIPTSANQEDHVSMGPIAARKAMAILTNAQRVLAIEFLCAAQGLDFRLPLRPGIGTGAAYDTIRQAVPHLDDDRPLYEDIERMMRLITGGEILGAVGKVVGTLA
ncbi:MAG: histidine ammonia-lyase [Candidatus Latescibacteria bacterium]|nr:histidine ammonia-lyase [Candidatus Latescibacterota bacterium]